MTTEEADDFLQTIRSIDPTIEDLEEAIILARSMVLHPHKDVYQIELPGGTFISDDHESRWFMHTDLRTAVLKMAVETI